MCIAPILIDNPSYKFDKNAFSKIPVDCGECPQCIMKRCNAWIFKLQQEFKRSVSAYFVTLTYAPESMSRENGRVSPNGFMTLVKRDFQLFFKRLRKASPPGLPIKYFLGAEYGSKWKRPHAHIIIFNSFPELIIKAWTENGQAIGKVHFGDNFSDAAINYTVKYMYKGRDIPAFEEDDRLPEFHLFSKGLGSNYLTPEIIAYHNSDPENRNCVILPGGIRAALPRLFRDKIFPQDVLKHMGRKNQDRFIQLELERQRQFAREYGSLKDYYRLQIEQKRVAIEAFTERAKARD